MRDEARESKQQPEPNAWRIYDSWGEHVATVYHLLARDHYLQNNKGYTAKPVNIQLKHGW